MGFDLRHFSDNLESVRARMTRAALRAGRDPADLQLMGVTKTLPPEYVEVARQAGMTLFGENRVQEAQVKYRAWLDAPDLELHLIGHLQRNKARTAASLFRCVQSIDKLQTAEALDRCCGELGREMDILLELNTSGEQSKFGYADCELLWRGCEEIAGLKHLRIRGLMTVGPFTRDDNRLRRAFAALRECGDGLQTRFAELSADVLSMGMSGDFELAIEEGSNLVRLGTILFGPREGTHG